MLSHGYFWQLLQSFDPPLDGSDEVRQAVEQNSAGEPFLWKAVCPLSRFFLQLEQDMWTDDGLMQGRVSPEGVTEYTEPILRSSCQKEE